MGYISMSMVYNLLTEKKALILSEKQLKQYEEMAIAQYKAELNKPKVRTEKNTFKAILESYTRGNNLDEQKRIEQITKEIAAREFISECKEKQINLKQLLQ